MLSPPLEAIFVLSSTVFDHSWNQYISNFISQRTSSDWFPGLSRCHLEQAALVVDRLQMHLSRTDMAAATRDSQASEIPQRYISSLGALSCPRIILECLHLSAWIQRKLVTYLWSWNSEKAVSTYTAYLVLIGRNSIEHEKCTTIDPTHLL